jgi:hypothetical protein
LILGSVTDHQGDKIIADRCGSALRQLLIILRRPLDQYRIVYFATHALVSGETEQAAKGLAEPALALSLPATATALDDGLLTSSEVAQLKLNAAGKAVELVPRVGLGEATAHGRQDDRTRGRFNKCPFAPM